MRVKTIELELEDDHGLLEIGEFSEKATSSSGILKFHCCDFPIAHNSARKSEMQGRKQRDQNREGPPEGSKDDWTDLAVLSFFFLFP